MATDTTELYWDCECNTRFIHSKAVTMECTRCGTVEADQPDSHRTEAVQMLQAKINAGLARVQSLTTALRALHAEANKPEPEGEKLGVIFPPHAPKDPDGK